MREYREVRKGVRKNGDDGGLCSIFGEGIYEKGSMEGGERWSRGREKRNMENLNG